MGRHHFFAKGERIARDWVPDKTFCVPDGNARGVAAGIRRRVTTARHTKITRKKADAYAAYLLNKAPFLGHPTALAVG